MGNIHEKRKKTIILAQQDIKLCHFGAKSDVTLGIRDWTSCHPLQKPFNNSYLYFLK